jgi:hypothetical protein
MVIAVRPIGKAALEPAMVISAIADAAAMEARPCVNDSAPDTAPDAATVKRRSTTSVERRRRPNRASADSSAVKASATDVRSCALKAAAATVKATTSATVETAASPTVETTAAASTASVKAATSTAMETTPASTATATVKATATAASTTRTLL